MMIVMLSMILYFLYQCGENRYYCTDSCDFGVHMVRAAVQEKECIVVFLGHVILLLLLTYAIMEVLMLMIQIFIWYSCCVGSYG